MHMRYEHQIFTFLTNDFTNVINLCKVHCVCDRKMQLHRCLSCMLVMYSKVSKSLCSAVNVTCVKSPAEMSLIVLF